MWILFSRIASAFREWWYFSRLSRIRSGRRRGRKVYESWVIVKIPLLWNFFRSFSVMFANKLRSSFSRAFCRQRSWNSHSLQCRFSKIWRRSARRHFSHFRRQFPNFAQQALGLDLERRVLITMDDFAHVD